MTGTEEVCASVEQITRSDSYDISTIIIEMRNLQTNIHDAEYTIDEVLKCLHNWDSRLSCWGGVRRLGNRCESFGQPIGHVIRSMELVCEDIWKENWEACALLENLSNWEEQLTGLTEGMVRVF